MKFCTPRLAVACLLLSLVALPNSLRAQNETDNLIEGGHWKRAKLAIEARVKANPKDARAYYDLSRVALAFEDFDQAEHAGEKAVDMNGSNADYHAQLATAYASAAEHALVLKQVVLVHRMRHEIEAAFAINPNNIDALLVDAAFDWQAPAVIGGSRQKSLAIVDRLKAISPLWGNLMEARLFQNEDKNRTQQALQAAANVKPAFYRAQVLLADFYAAGSDAAKWPEAERIATETLHQYPDRIGAYKILAKLYAEQGRISDLDRLLSDAERNVPDDLSPFYFSAKVLLERSRNPERSESYLLKYLSQAPEASEPEPAAARTLLTTAAQRVSAQSASLRRTSGSFGASQ